METRLAATRSAAASSLGIDECDLDKKFASNCVEERIKTLQDKVRLAHQQMQGIQQGAEGAAAAAEARRAEGALVQRNLEEEVARLLMRGKFLDVVSQEVADFVGAGGGASQSSDVAAHREPFAFTVHARGCQW